MQNSTSTPLVSVIIPTYNRPAYLEAAIASVLRQTVQDFEIIVSDDCSAANPEPLVQSFHDPRIRFRRNSTNLGIAWNATHAFQMARGKYVSSLNDDDLWTEHFLEKLIAPLEADPSLILAFCDYWVIDADGSINPQNTEQQTRKEGRDRLHQGVYQPFWKIGLVDQAVFTSSGAVIRSEAIAWDELPTAGVFWDYYLAYLACRSERGAYYCPERLMHYRRHPQSENMISGSRDAQAKIRKGKAGITCYERFAADVPPDLKPHFQREWAHANTTLAIGLMRDHAVAAARPYLRRSLTRYPWSLRTLVALALSYLPRSFAHSLVQLRNPGVLSKAR